MITNHFVAQMRLNPPASREQIRTCEREMGITLPTEYVAFLLRANGGEGPVGDVCYASFWKVDQLPKLNTEYEVRDYAPGLVLFGSDGGGEAFAFDTRGDRWNVVQLPFVGMALDACETLGPTFDSFLEFLHNTKD